jgi:hypothetical protein
VVTAAHAQQTDGATAPREPWQRSDGEFGALLIVTDEIESFLEAWSKPPAAGYAPSIKPAERARRGGVVTAVVLFSGCAAAEDGNCRCDADLTVLLPDGSVYGEHRGVPVWDSAPPPGHNLQLSNGRLKFRIEDHDPLGTYRIQALVRDLVAKRSVLLEWKIEVVPSEAS